jgi:hypothetical protein
MLRIPHCLDNRLPRNINILIFLVLISVRGCDFQQTTQRYTSEVSELRYFPICKHLGIGNWLWMRRSSIMKSSRAISCVNWLKITDDYQVIRSWRWKIWYLKHPSRLMARDNVIPIRSDFRLFLSSSSRNRLALHTCEENVCHLESNGVIESCCVPASSKNEEVTLFDNGNFSVYSRNATPIKILLLLWICNVVLSIKMFSHFQDCFILRAALIAYKTQVGMPKIMLIKVNLTPNYPTANLWFVAVTSVYTFCPATLHIQQKYETYGSICVGKQEAVSSKPQSMKSSSGDEDRRLSGEVWRWKT